METVRGIMARHHTQWAAQFAVASELCKRGCDVSFTMGNCTPLADLLVLAPHGETFLVDVKGLAKANFWQIRAKPPRPNLYYVLCLDPSGGANRFFPLSQVTLNAHLSAYEKSGVKYDERFSGMNWGTASTHENDWAALPLASTGSAA